MNVRPTSQHPVHLSPVSPQSVKALVARHAAALREAHLGGKNVDRVTLEQEDNVTAYMTTLSEDEKQRFAELYADEMQRMMATLLAEADGLGYKKSTWDEHHTRNSHRVAIWLFLVLMLVFLIIAVKA